MHACCNDNHLYSWSYVSAIMLNRQKNLIDLKLRILGKSLNSTSIVLQRKMKTEKNKGKHTSGSVYMNITYEL